MNVSAGGSAVLSQVAMEMGQSAEFLMTVLADGLVVANITGDPNSGLTLTYNETVSATYEVLGGLLDTTGNINIVNNGSSPITVKIKIIG